MTVLIDDAARADLFFAAERLNDEHDGYGDDLVDLFAVAVSEIAARPRLYSPTEDGPPGIETWEYFIRRFDYRVIFAFLPMGITIVALTHAAQRPGVWARRLPRIE